jgi:hypothetical protein
MGDVRRRGGSAQISLSAEEAGVLLALTTQVADMLAEEAVTQPESTDPLELLVEMAAAPVNAPEDPALQRLLPDAYGEDPAAAGEFRRLMDGELRRQKTEALEDIRDALTGSEGSSLTLRLPPQQVESWLQALNDVRLVVGTRLDVTEDLAETWQQLARDDPRVPLFVAYDWLGWLQESLVSVLD